MTRWKIDPAHLPAGFRYPRAFDHLLEREMVRLWNFCVLEAEDAWERMAGMRRRYPTRLLVPFAKDGRSDDVACFEHGSGPGFTAHRVVLVDDHAPPGFEDCGSHPDLLGWLRDTLAEALIDLEMEIAHDGP